MSLTISELEQQLQAAIEELSSDAKQQEDLRSRIAQAETQKRRIESQLATLQEQERLKQVESDLGSEVHQLRELGDRINESSRDLFKLVSEFEALSKAIGAKQGELKHKPMIEIGPKPEELPVVLHREGEPSIFLISRARAAIFRNDTTRFMGRDYQFPVDEILG